MTLKIAIVGPESSGKSTLAQELADYYEVPLVGEYAREYLNQLNRQYVEKDLIEIVQGQIELENKALKSNSQLIICDTNLLVIKVWSLYKYNRCAARIIAQVEKRHNDLQFLLKPDIPWEADPQRENPHDRDKLFSMYHNELKMSGNRFEIIDGLGDQRLKKALQYIDALGIG